MLLFDMEVKQMTPMPDVSFSAFAPWAFLIRKKLTSTNGFKNMD